MKKTKFNKAKIFETITDCRIVKNLTWKETREFLLETPDGCNINDITDLRKGWKIWYDTKNERFVEDKELLYLANQRNNILKERRINAIQRREILNQTQNLAYHDIILKAVEDNLGLITRKPIKKIVVEKNNSVAVPLYFISDEHYRGVKDNQLIERIFSNLKKDIIENKYKEIKLCLLGDGIDGLIHSSALLSNDGAVIPSIQYAQLIGEYIEELSEIVKLEVFFVIEANHSQVRPLNTNRTELVKEDLGYAIDGILKTYFRNNPNIEYNSGATIEFEHNDKNIFILHGHQGYAKSKDRCVAYFEQTHKYTPDMIVMGHWHTFKANKYAANKWLVVAPCCKDWGNGWDNDNGYGPDPCFMKITWNTNEYPEFKLIGTVGGKL